MEVWYFLKPIVLISISLKLFRQIHFKRRQKPADTRDVTSYDNIGKQMNECSNDIYRSNFVYCRVTVLFNFGLNLELGYTVCHGKKSALSVSFITPSFIIIYNHCSMVQWSSGSAHCIKNWSSGLEVRTQRSLCFFLFFFFSLLFFVHSFIIITIISYFCIFYFDFSSSCQWRSGRTIVQGRTRTAGQW